MNIKFIQHMTKYVCLSHYYSTRSRFCL